MSYNPLSGAKALRLKHDLARGDVSQTQLAEDYGYTKETITHFKNRNKEEIDAIAAKLVEDEYKDLWVTKKALRLAEYQKDIDEADEYALDHSQGAIARLRHAALRAVADELGDIPNRVEHGGNVGVNYTINGVGPDEF